MNRPLLNTLSRHIKLTVLSNLYVTGYAYRPYDKSVSLFHRHSASNNTYKKEKTALSGFFYIIH